MANWCRSLVLAVGDEAEISRFLDYTVTKTGAEETAFTEDFETGVMYRDSGAVRIEVMSKWEPPIEELIHVSQEFPRLRFAVEWEQGGDELCGCASIANGSSELALLNRKVYVIENDDEEDEDMMYENAMMLRFETMRETSRLLFGSDWREEGGPWGEDTRQFHEAAQQIANSAFVERRDWGEVVRESRQRWNNIFHRTLGQ